MLADHMSEKYTHHLESDYKLILILLLHKLLTHSLNHLSLTNHFLPATHSSLSIQSGSRDFSELKDGITNQVPDHPETFFQRYNFLWYSQIQIFNEKMDPEIKIIKN